MNAISTFLREHAGLQSLPAILFDTALKGAVLVAITALAAYLLRNRSAASRHALWTAAVLGHLSIPVLSLVVPEWRVPLVPAAAWMQPATGSGAVARSTAEGPAAQGSASSASLESPTAAAGSSAPASALPPAIPRARDGNDPSAAPPSPNALKRIASAGLVPLLVILWIAGLSLVLLRLALGTWRVGQLARDGSRVDDGVWLSLTQRVANRLGVSRPLTLLRGARLAVPVTWGIVYPAVLLPEDADTWTEARKRFVLVHEMAHIKRFDALTQLLSQISVAIFWFDPLVWLAAHRMKVEREHACDDYVLRDGTAPSLYAGELLTMVRSIGTRDHDRAAPAFAALAMARRSEFEGRMLAILDPRLDRKQLNRKGALMTALMVALLTIPLAALRPFQPRDLPASAAAVARVPDASPVTNTPQSATGTTVKAASPVTSASSGRSCDSYVARDHGFMVELVGTRNQGTSTHISTSDGAPSILNFVATSPGRCAEASVLGPIRFSADEREVTSLAPGGFARFRELTASFDRGVSITADVRGTMTYAASLNGQPAPFDQSAKAWLAQFLPVVVRESGINTKERVARIRSQSGVPGVLREIDAIRSPSAKRSHYQELLKTGSLASGDAERVLRQAGNDLKSSGDLSSVVQQVPRSTLSTASSRQAVADALSRIVSSGDRARTITVMAPTADKELLLVLMDAAADLPSSGDKSNFLRSTADQYLRGDESLRRAFFRTARTIASAGDLRNVLVSAIPYTHASPSIAMDIIGATEFISSNGDISDVLISLIAQRAITAQSQAATIALLRRTMEMSSSGDRANVLITLATGDVLSTPAVRDAFTKAALDISSAGDRERVLSAAAAR